MSRVSLTRDSDEEDERPPQHTTHPEYDSTITFHEILRQHEQYQQQALHEHQQPHEQHDWSTALYPNLSDPCNKRMIADLPPLKWGAVPLVRQIGDSAVSQGLSDKFAEFYDLQERDLERLEQHHQLQQRLQFQDQPADMTSLPQRAFSAPLHTPSAGGMAPLCDPSSASLMPPAFQSSQSTAYPLSGSNRYGDNGDGTGALASPHRRHSPPRTALPPVRRQQRHSTTAVPGDIESSSSGLRPRVNYKAIYNRRFSSASSAATPPNLEASLSGFSCGGDSDDMGAGGSCGSGDHHHQDLAACMEESTTTSTTMIGSSRRSFLDHESSHQPLHHHYHHHPVMEEEEEEPVPQEDHSESESAPARTMEIAPNVHVQVRSSQETYKAVQSGDYTVATCFACCATIVCVNDAAYVLCPDCQVVSPLGFGAPTADASKKDDPYGIGTGLKREWVDEHVR
ncbi:expressed unknown protein [Seminavis robusta]|uniref:Uncharacterized protein n=1 Tax=Seminavis robusta TaxID=568900 RepID=A0A9N8EBN9_9STRA|nr:expressed unknown protein [Seminavis robusta]|eukprot:Sro725_g193320.1 n/a (454) ;mRNA; f:29501-30862